MPRLLPAVALYLALVCLAVVGCTATTLSEGAPGGPPAWLDHFGVFEGPQGRCVEAVGSSLVGSDPGSRRTTALSNGRSQLARTVAGFTRLLAGEFIDSLRDSFADELVESGRFVETVSRWVTDEVMGVSPREGESQPQRWTDPMTRTTYVLMRLELETLFTSYRTQMDRAFRRESTLGALSVGATEYAAQVDAQLGRVRTQAASELTKRVRSRWVRRRSGSSGTGDQR